MEDAERYDRRSLHNGLIEDEDDIEEQAEEYTLPANRLMTTLVISVISGIIIIGFNIGFYLLNGSTFDTIAKAGNKVSDDVALNGLGLQCLNYSISLILCMIAGYVLGRIVVQRRLGFLLGVIAGLIGYIVSIATNYIPNFPGRQTTSPVASANSPIGIVAVLIVGLAMWTLIFGLFSLLGAWIATRRHPYYARREE